jgi:hypothetical protein
MKKPDGWPPEWPWLGDDVKLKPLDGVPAMVEEVSIGRVGLSVRVAYWVDGRRMVEWVNLSELV